MIRALPRIPAPAATLAASLFASQAGAFQPLGGLSGDWNEDGHPDLVLLLRCADDTADLVVFLGDVQSGLTEAVRAPGAIYAGGLAGQVPRLQSHGARGFIVTQEQTAIGRTPWMLNLTVAYRPRLGGFVVAGYTHAVYDRLDPDAGGECDVNLLTGNYARQSLAAADTAEVDLGTVDPAPLRLADLTLDWRPAPCDPS